MVTAFEYIGNAFFKIVKSFYDTFYFSITVILRILDRGSYNSAVKMVLLKQIYFTSVQILPLFVCISVLFGSMVIIIVFQIMKSLGLVDYLGQILMGFIVTELAPFTTVLLIALRSGSAINTEIAVMKVNNEINTLETFNIDIITYLFLPRIINGVVSVVLLSSLFSILSLTSGFLFSKLIFDMNFALYTNVLLKSANFYDILISLIKCSTFGFFITLIPIQFGRQASHELTSIPISVLNGMLKVFIAIIIIEVLSLILSSL
jgi:phospholipid/cholesterol/gamma-HCH transport system permease protein